MSHIHIINASGIIINSYTELYRASAIYIVLSILILYEDLIEDLPTLAPAADKEYGVYQHAPAHC